MALCFTHSAAGYLGYEAIRPEGAHRPMLLAAAVVLANAPDVDFLPGMLVGHPGAYHRGVTHTILAVVAVGALVALGVRLAGRGRLARRAGLWATAVYASHLLVDYLTVDSIAPHGGRFLWPLSEAYWYAPVTPFREIVIDPSGTGAFLGSLIAPHTIGVWAFEIGVLLASVAAVHAVRAWQSAPAWQDVREGSS